MIGAIVIGSGEGAAAPRGHQRRRHVSDSTDRGTAGARLMPVAPLVLVGVAGLLVGLFAGRVRPRTTR